MKHYLWSMAIGALTLFIIMACSHESLKNFKKGGQAKRVIKPVFYNQDMKRIELSDLINGIHKIYDHEGYLTEADIKNGQLNGTVKRYYNL